MLHNDIGRHAGGKWRGLVIGVALGFLTLTATTNLAAAAARVWSVQQSPAGTPYRVAWQAGEESAESFQVAVVQNRVVAAFYDSVWTAPWPAGQPFTETSPKLEALTLASNGKRMLLAAFNGDVYATDDGQAWRKTKDGLLRPGHRCYLASIAFGAGKWVAVGKVNHGAGESRPVILHSGDGQVWTEVAGLELPERWLIAVVFLKDRFIAVNEDGTSYVSADGQAWKRAGGGDVGREFKFGVVDGQLYTWSESGVAVTNNGETWAKLPVPMEAGIQTIFATGGDAPSAWRRARSETAGGPVPLTQLYSADLVAAQLKATTAAANKKVTAAAPVPRKPAAAPNPALATAVGELEKTFRAEFVASANMDARIVLVRDYGWKFYRVGQVQRIPEREVAVYFTRVVAELLNQNSNIYESHGLVMTIPEDVYNRNQLVETLKPELWDLVQSAMKRTVADFEASQRAIRDFQEAKRYAESGNLKGMINLSAFYRDGYGTNKNPAEAERWAKKAEELEKARAARSAAAAGAAGGAPPGSKVGSFWEGGVIIALDGTGRHGLMIALNQLSSVSYPKSTPEKAQGNGPFSEWYIPSLNEWKLVHANRREIERGLQAAKGAPLDGRFWSSTAVTYNTSRGILVANRWSIFPLSGENSESTVATDLCHLRLIRTF